MSPKAKEIMSRNYLVGFRGRSPQVYCYGVNYIHLMTKKEAADAISALTEVLGHDTRRVFRLVEVRCASRTRRKS